MPFFIFLLIILLIPLSFNQASFPSTFRSKNKNLSSNQSRAERIRVKESPSQVWKVGNHRWTAEEEIRYGKWVEENITEDFFLRYKILIDCADVPYATRWIYSRIAHLPAAATTKDGKLIGHWSANWSKFPAHRVWDKDLRFRKALLDMLSETTTRTLPSDTYPVRIDRDSITPGTVFFITESHSGIISRVVLDGSTAHPLQTWESTEPVKLQKLNGWDFLITKPESTTYSGLVKFRWPIFKDGQWKYFPADKHPFYSLEQYSAAFTEGYADINGAIAKRIDPVDYDPWGRMEKVLNTAVQYIRERVPIVLAGYERCHKGGCPEGSDLWEIYSTPGRDGKIILLMDYLRHLVDRYSLDRDAVKEMMEGTSILIQNGQSVTFYHLYQNSQWLSPHPGDSIEARWGLKKCEMIQSRLQTAQDSIAFIEKTYRKKDPNYADFSIRQQQEAIYTLKEEWERSECPNQKAEDGKR